MLAQLRLEHVVATPELVSEVASFYRATRENFLPDKRFVWLYLENPHGPAHLQLLRGPDSAIEGVTAAIPVRVQLDGGSAVAWNMFDFTLGRSVRTLGPAITLRRALLKEADKRGIAVVFAFPDRVYTPLHERLRPRTILPNASLLIPVNIRATTRWLAEKVAGPRALVKTATACTPWWTLTVGSVAAAYRARSTSWDEVCQLVHQFNRKGAASPFSFGLSADWIAWRFQKCPLYECTPWVIERRDRPASIAVTAEIGTSWWLKLLWPPARHTGPLKALCHAIASNRRQPRDGLIRAVVPRNHWLLKITRRLRYPILRDGSVTVIYTAPPGPAEAGDPAKWDRLVADRDM